MTPLPVVVAAPYLQLRDFARVGDWEAGPLDSFSGPWASAEFERLARRFLTCHRTASGTPIDNPALVVRRDSGADGQPPAPGELDALQAAIGFAALDQNGNWEPDGQGMGHCDE